MSGTISLGEVAERAPMVAVACNRCDRAGQYRTAALVAKHGAHFSVPAWLRVLSGDCPHRGLVNIHSRCGVHVPSLFGIGDQPQRATRR